MRKSILMLAIACLCACPCSSGAALISSASNSKKNSADLITFTSTSKYTDYTAKDLSFTFTISKPRKGKTAIASTTAAWITNVKVSGNTVSYTVAENNSRASRTGKIKVMYKKFYKEFEVTQDRKRTINGHEFVDLGLSVKWATCNVGASKPEDYGGYYQWAGTEDVSDKSIHLDWSNCPYHTGSDRDTGWTKYVPSDKSSYWSGTGNPDNKLVLDPGDDVASIEWKGPWRIPTEAEWQELMNPDNCSWTWVRYFISRIEGYKVRSKKPGYTNEEIFLPAHVIGHYMSSSLKPYSPEFVYSVYFRESEGVHMVGDFRYDGQSVRPVSE